MLNNNPKIFIGADHRAYENKNLLVDKLRQIGYEVIDCGPYFYNPKDDYTDIAISVSKKMSMSNEKSVGILICSSGLGMYMTANKFNGIIGGESYSVEEAITDKKHHGSNLLVLNEHTSSDIEKSLELIIMWINTPFEEGTRHERRVKQINAIEKIYLKSVNNIEIVPAVLEYDLDKYHHQIKKLQHVSNLLHLDIMDGEFVSTESPSTAEVLDIIKYDQHSSLYSLHLMTKTPLNEIKYISEKNHEKVYLVYIHAEALSMKEIENEIINAEYPFQIGLVFNPDTDISKYKEYIKYFSVIQLMTVFPGKQGGEFQSQVLEKINIIKSKEYLFSGQIHLDGGINKNTIQMIKKYSPDLIGVGSAIAKSPTPKRSFSELMRIVNA